MLELGEDGILDLAKGAVEVGVVFRCRRLTDSSSCCVVSIRHLCVTAIFSLAPVVEPVGSVAGVRGRRRWVEKHCPLGVAGDHGDLVGVVDGQVGVDEKKEAGERRGERQGGSQQSPGMRIGIEDDGEKRRRGLWIRTLELTDLCT